MACQLNVFAQLRSIIAAKKISSAEWRKKYLKDREDMIILTLAQQTEFF